MVESVFLLMTDPKAFLMSLSLRFLAWSGFSLFFWLLFLIWTGLSEVQYIVDSRTAIGEVDYRGVVSWEADGETRQYKLDPPEELLDDRRRLEILYLPGTYFCRPAVQGINWFPFKLMLIPIAGLVIVILAALKADFDSRSGRKPRRRR